MGRTVTWHLKVNTVNATDLLHAATSCTPTQLIYQQITTQTLSIHYTPPVNGYNCVPSQFETTVKEHEAAEFSP